MIIIEQNITDILHIIKENGADLSQRELANKSGFSLGNVNKLLKKCAKKGLVEIKDINTRKVKYLLTPKGMKIITNKTLNYIQESYKILIQLKNLMHKLIEEEFPDKEIYILRKNSKKFQEVWELVRSNLNRMDKNYRIYNSITELNAHITKNEAVIFYWDPELEDDLNELEIDCVNIIHRLRIGNN